MRNLEGLRLTEELRNRPTESRPPEDWSSWLSERKWGALVHMRPPGWGLGSAPCSWVGLAWLVTVRRALASASALTLCDGPSTSSSLPYRSHNFGVTLWFVALLPVRFQFSQRASGGGSDPTRSQGPNAILSHCCRVTLTMQPPTRGSSPCRNGISFSLGSAARGCRSREEKPVY